MFWPSNLQEMGRAFRQDTRNNSMNRSRKEGRKKETNKQTNKETKVKGEGKINPSIGRERPEGE
jgi:hypothetical protein